MSELEILRWPDPRLMETCSQIGEITPEIEALAADMLATMYAASGRGLAAPQVGAMVRMFVMDTGWKEDKPDPLVCINPMLMEVSEERATNAEGCLSIPGYYDKLTRAAKVVMRAWTLDGKAVEIEAEEMLLIAHGDQERGRRIGRAEVDHAGVRAPVSDAALGAAEDAAKFSVGTVVQDVIAAVTIEDVEAAVRPMECPRGTIVAFLCVFARADGESPFTEHFASER